MKSQAAKQLGTMMAGQNLGKFFDTISTNVGKIARSGTQSALRAGTDTFMPGVAQKALPEILRSGTTSLIPQTAQAAAQLGVAGLGAAALDKVFDQQSAYKQSMRGGTGNAAMDQFLYGQQLQNQKFMHELMLVQARAESRIPGAQYSGSLKNNDLGDRAFEKSILDEVGVFGRGLYGTGLRA